MFEVGFSELLVIFALALIVLGPSKLPGLVSQMGRWIGRARGMARQFREQLEAEADRQIKDLDPHIDPRIEDPPTPSKPADSTTQTHEPRP